MAGIATGVVVLTPDKAAHVSVGFRKPHPALERVEAARRVAAMTARARMVEQE